MVFFLQMTLAVALTTGREMQSLLQGPPASSTAQQSILQRARALRKQHRLISARDLLQDYITTHPSDAPALTLLAEIQYETGDDAVALRLLAQALHAEPRARDANLVAGRLLLEQKRFPEAMDRFETLLEVSPHDEAVRALELDAVTKLAASAAQAGKPEAALQALLHARTKMPDNSALLMAVGLQALDLRLFDESAEALESARAISPSDPDISYALARLEIEEQHLPQAEADLKTYLAARSNDASAHFGLGRVLAMLQRDEEAKREFEESVKLQPQQTESYYQLGRLALNAHRNETAESLFQRVVARDPKHGGALAGLGQLAFQAKDYQRAQSFLSRAVEAAPDYGPAHYYFGLTLARLGKKQDADRELQIATRLGKAAAAPVQSRQPSESP